MKLTQEKTIRHSAFHIALSPDGTKAAISGERSICVYSLPGFEKLDSFRVANTSSMAYLADSTSLLILNTTGRLFLWNGTEVQKRGKWPVPQWRETPLMYAGEDRVLWAGKGGIWKYDASAARMENIYETQLDVKLCGCSDGIVKFTASEAGAIGRQHIRFAKMTLSGELLHQGQTIRKLPGMDFHLPAWSDGDRIAYAAVTSPALLTGPAVQGWLYLIDAKTGEVLSQRKMSHEEAAGHVFSGNKMFALCNTTFLHEVTFYDARAMIRLCTLEKERLRDGLTVNPPSQVVFLPDGRILVGTWCRLFVFRMEE